MNLYKEIEEDLKVHNKKISDIKWISIENNNNHWKSDKSYLFCVDINEFLEIAKITNYDNGYGGAEIPMGLKIVGDNWWLERYEYDGSEWFEFKTYPSKPEEIRKINKIQFLADDLDDEED